MRQSTTLGVALLLTTLAAGFAQAQDKRATMPERVYVPIEDFDKIFDKERGGVFVPYDELKELVRRANATSTAPKPADVKPPTDYVLVGTSFSGKAGAQVVQFTATFDVEVLESERWVVVPVGLGEASLEEVRTGKGQRAVVGPMAVLADRVAALDRKIGFQRKSPLPRTGYGIIMKGAGRIQATAKFAVPIQSKPGESSFNLSLPGAPLTRFEVNLPESGLRVAVPNALATEESSVAGKDETSVRAYFGAAANAKVTWNPKLKTTAADLDPLVFAHTETSLNLNEGVLRTRTRITYKILQAPCGEFKVRYPKGYTLLGVDGQNMSAYPAPQTTQSGDQLITIRLHEKAAEAYNLEVRLERILKDGTTQVDFPKIATVGTERESGVLAARASEFMTLEPEELKGLSQIDASGITPTLASDLGWAAKGRNKGRAPLVFRFLRQPYGLSLKTSPIEPEVDGRVFTLATVRDDNVRLATTVNYTIRKRGIFGVRLRIPRELRIVQVGNERIVKDYRVEKASAEDVKNGLGDILVVDFVRQVQPQKNFSLTIQGDLVRPQQPETAEVGFVMPRVHLLDVEKEIGRLGVGGESHLKVSLKKNPGLVTVGARELYGLGFPHRAGKGEELTFGFKYSKPEGIAAEFTVKKRESKVTANVETHVDAQEDIVKVSATINYTVQFAGVEQVRIRVPEALKKIGENGFEIKGDTIKDKNPSEPKDGKVTWTVRLQGKRTGTFPIQLEYDIKLGEFRAGEEKKITLHEVEVLDTREGVDDLRTETGDYALTKHENLVITEHEDSTAIERRDKRELPEALRRKGPIHAYRYLSHPHKLALKITRYDFKAPLGTLVKHLHLDEVVGGDGKMKIEATLSLQNNAAQFLTILLPPNAEMKGLRVDGKNEEWSEGDPVQGRPSVQVHLGEVTKVHKQKPFQIRIRYDIEKDVAPLSGTGSVELFTLLFPLENFEEDPIRNAVPVAHLTRNVFLPDGFAYLEFDTDASKHFDETSLWESIKKSLGVRTGQERYQSWRAQNAAGQAIQALFAMPVQADDSGIYPDLVKPSTLDPFLMEKLDNPSSLNVRYMSWAMFYVLDALVFLGVIVLGVVLVLRKVVSSVFYTAAAAGLMLLGATFLGKSLEPFFQAGLVGSVGLGGFFFVRGIWGELTVKRHERRLAELAAESELARSRTRAAESEARTRGDISISARGDGGTATAVAPPKANIKRMATADEQAEADKIQMDDDEEGENDA